MNVVLREDVLLTGEVELHWNLQTASCEIGGDVFAFVDATTITAAQSLLRLTMTRERCEISDSFGENAQLIMPFSFLIDSH